MNKALPVLKKMLKVILWMAGVLVLLFVILALIIQIPAVQNKIVHSATSFVSDKTHTRVEIKNVSISFPKSVVVEGLYLEDLKKDTLIYAGKIKANVSLYNLLFSKININSITIENLNLNAYNTNTDSVFNYNFLITAFADSTIRQENKPATSSKSTFNIDKVNLKDIRLRYDDAYSGMRVSASLGKLRLKVDKLDIPGAAYGINELLVEKLRVKVGLTQSKKTSTQKSEGILPQIKASGIRINNSSFTLEDAVNGQSVYADIRQFELKAGSVDLQKELIYSDRISLSGSNIHYFTTDKNTATQDATPNTTEPGTPSDWKVSVKQLNLENNSLAYDIRNKPYLKNTFDASHLHYKHVKLVAKDLYYSTTQTKVRIEKFSAMDQNNFRINHFETDFSMNPHAIAVKKLKANTAGSSVTGDVSLKFSSLQALKTSFPMLMLDVNLKKLILKNSDILYFSPQLGTQAFFQNKNTITTASGRIHGRVNNLNGKNIEIETGVSTLLETDFSIRGLPDARNAYYAFPNLKLTSGRQDILMMAGKAIPSTLSLPEEMVLILNFEGKLKAFQAGLGLSSSFGNISMLATLETNENFSGSVDISDFDMGSLLKNKTMYGPVTMTAHVDGHGLKAETMTAQIKANVSEIYLNEYLYHNLHVDGTARGREFAGKVNLNDKNAVLDFDGLVNLTPNQEKYKFHLNVQGADLQKLNFSKKDMRIGLDATADLTGNTINNLNGKAGISNLIMTQNGKKYSLDSVSMTSVNTPEQSEFNLKSALLDFRYQGAVALTALPAQLTRFVNHYFPLSDVKTESKDTKPSDFKFQMQLYNHPILSEVLVPDMKEFEPGLITGSFDSKKNSLNLNASIKRMLYGSTEVNNLVLDVNSDSTALNYRLSGTGIANSQINFANLLFEGQLANNRLSANLSSIDQNKIKKLAIKSQLTRDKANYKLSIDSTGFYLMNNRWKIAPDNFVEFGKQGFRAHNLFMNNDRSQLNIASVHDKFDDDLNIGIKNFKLEDISGIVEKDSSLIKGNVDGNVLLKRVNKSYGIIADANITDLFVRNVLIGNLALKGENPSTQRFDIKANLSGKDNNLTANGYFLPNAGNNSLNIKADIQSLSMKTLEAFSMGQIKQASGTLSGNFLIAGNTAAPDITGQLTFNNAFLNPSYFNNRYELKHETLRLEKDGIYFDKFTLADVNQHKAVIDGNIKMKRFTDYVFGLQVNTRDFLLFNTTVQDNKEFYGRMVIDSKIDLSGTMNLPVVNASVKMKKGSNFTFAVPEDKVTTDKGEDVVEFNTKQNLNSILYHTDKKVIKKSGFTGFDLSSILQVDKEATLRLLMDPTSSDSLVVRGDAALSFAMDKSGKMSLTGAYNLDNGSYLISIESVIKRKFNIISGSTIVWNGDPLDADININAGYTVRAAPYDLVADQMVGLSAADQGGYKQMYAFTVLLKLRGPILKPEISFEIQLRPEDKGIMSGAVNQKLIMLNDDPSALNKQVFALLVLGRFVQENPLQTEIDPTSTLVRSTIGNLLSAQLNQLSSKIIPGMSLNFDVQSYNDYQSGQAQGRTQVEIGLKKELFNQRLTVQVGGTVDVEGEKAKQNSTSEITSDVNIEYKLTKDGRYRFKGFRHNLYDGAIEGQIVETGGGVIYVRDFNKWKEFFRAPKKRTKKTPNP
ncbi:protein of unknown function DUF490 [Paludibacter propionicigenes WB4]|uniref:Translocation and assembly module TamB C-terminal domain-containing protein n=1 Tax=Paludibacter propionicigenes (strain DSM 17365 / JCM 13257 / WB4) TaxID=694427 RepID=E4T7T7_PALPW|nr:translocation/assembly module TamB domain-containing protein [Paludibacter propionicigenes]ADQ80781.1 protein of unknown function DUF490 [Paludibacter propionicigenes WB4]